MPSDYFKFQNQANYQPWKIRLSDFKKNWNPNKKITFFLKFGILAPSTHNSQPWIFEFLEPNQVTIRPNWDYMLPATDPKNRNLYISLGCALTNIKVVASYFGFVAEEKFSKLKKDHVATLNFKEGKAPSSSSQFADLASAITERFSNKSAYDSDEVSEVFLKKVVGQISNSEFSLAFVAVPDKRKKIADLYWKAASGFAENPMFREELSFWLRRNDTKGGDGMPGFVAQLSLIQSIVGKKLMKYFPPLPKIQVKKDARHLSRGPVIGMISSSGNTPTDHILTGEKYQELALKCTKNGLSLTPMTALIERPDFHRQLRNIFRESKPHQQMFFRLGYSKGERYHTPRKPIEDSLL